MQGEIDVVSEVEKGTTFTIHIPFKIDAEEKERKPEKEEQEQSIEDLFKQSDCNLIEKSYRKPSALPFLI